MILEFATNEELIKELTMRTTFAGVVVCSKKEQKTNEVHDNWDVYSSLNLGQTKIILEHALEQTETHGEN